jgi:hypothetical protein
MRLRVWFRRERNGARSGEEREKPSGRQGSGEQGRMKQWWRSTSPEERRWDDRERSTMIQERPLSHGLF